MIYDINLIPKNKKKSSSSSHLILALLSISCIVVLALFGFYFPYQDKNTLKDKIKEQQDEVKDSSEVELTYTNLISERDTLVFSNTMLDSIKSSKFDVVLMMEEVEQRIPETIILKEISLEAGLLTLKGTSPSYTDIASLIVKLREMNGVLDVSFLSATVDEANGGTAAEDSISEPISEFSVYVRLNTVDILAQFMQDQDALVTETVQEVEQNETNE